MVKISLLNTFLKEDDIKTGGPEAKLEKKVVFLLAVSKKLMVKGEYLAASRTAAKASEFLQIIAKRKARELG